MKKSKFKSSDFQIHNLNPTFLSPYYIWFISMESDSNDDIDQYVKTQSILLAASNHDLQALRTLLRAGSANVQDPETKYTPLHSAIAACEVLVDSELPAQSALISDSIYVNGEYNENPKNGDDVRELAETSEEKNQRREDVPETGEDERPTAAIQTVKLLLENGAIWNDVDVNDETPGCLARRLGLKEIYEIMVDAGVRAEILLNRLDEYEMLRDAEGEEEEEIKNAGLADLGDDLQGGAATDSSTPQTLNEGPGLNPLTESFTSPPSHLGYDLKPTNATYLESPLTVDPERILNTAQNGVMMAWETSIMQHTAALLAPKPGLRILNIGHGMGIIDTFFQQKSPTEHHIIEAHPSILAHMEEEQWHEKLGVIIHAQRWQEAVPKLVAEGVAFDAIYFDTFAEDYRALRDFFSDWVLGLLDDGGRWGFFNGLGADRQICYDVYGKVVEMDLFEAGFDTEWETLQVPDMESLKEWQGVRRRYWALSEYRLPICRFLN